MTAETWLDAMPAIPLARGVPVRFARASTGVIMPGTALSGPENISVIDFGNVYYNNPAWARVDLDDPQGQRYAVNRLIESDSILRHAKVGDMPDVIWRLLRGQGTDADKLWLARALAEVV